MTSPSVFLSYSQRDRPQAQIVAEALERAHLAVWWDRKLQAGDEFPVEIEKQVRAAGCVVVLWTPDSTQSRWVRAEATIAAERGVLVPLRASKATVPLEFVNYQSLDIDRWLAAADPETEERLLIAVRSKLEPGGALSASEMMPRPDRVADLQRALLSAPTGREMKAAVYELEAIAQKNPSNVPARLLLDDYRNAMERDRTRHYADYSLTEYRLQSSRPFSVLRSLAAVAATLLALALIVQALFGLGFWQSMLAAVAVPIAVWLLFVALAGVVNAWEWLRTRLRGSSR